MLFTVNYIIGLLKNKDITKIKSGNHSLAQGLVATSYIYIHIIFFLCIGIYIL